MVVELVVAMFAVGDGFYYFGGVCVCVCACVSVCACTCGVCTRICVCVFLSPRSLPPPFFPLSSSLHSSLPFPFPVARTIIIKIQWNPLRLSSHVKWCVNDSSMCVIMCVRICAALRKCVWIWVFVFAYMWIHVCICVFADCCLG